MFKYLHPKQFIISSFRTIVLCTKFVTLYLVVQMMTHFNDEIIKADFFPILKITLYVSRGSICQGLQNITLSTIFPHSRLHTTWTVYFFIKFSVVDIIKWTKFYISLTVGVADHL